MLSWTQDVLSEIKVNVNPVNATCLGKKETGKTRAIKVRFENKDDKDSVLQNL